MNEHTFACRDDTTGLINVWDVHQLWEFVKEQPECTESINPLVQALSEHFNEYNLDDWSRVVQADLRYPIIIYGNYCIMDGCHRIAKAMLSGQSVIKVVRLKELPPPIKTYSEWIYYQFDYPPL